MSVSIWHNPRCSKSRETLALLEKQAEKEGFTFETRLYLKEVPSVSELQLALKSLGFKSARGLMRTKEVLYKELQLKDACEEDLLKAMAEHAKLIERPVVFRGDNARIGRPPALILELF